MYRRKKVFHILAILLSFLMMISVVDPVQATTISDLEKEKQELEKQKEEAQNKQKEESDKLNSVSGRIDSIQGDADAVAEEIDEADAALVETLASVEIIEEELSDRRSYLACAASAPTPAARQLMRRLAAEEGGHARRLMGVHYLITGQNYSAAVPLPTNIPCTGSWREVLRLRYHEESCSGLNYRRASEETTDECLSEILLELSHDEYRHARQLLCLLEKQMPI